MSSLCVNLATTSIFCPSSAYAFPLVPKEIKEYHNRLQAVFIAWKSQIEKHKQPSDRAMVCYKIASQAKNCDPHFACQLFLEAAKGYKTPSCKMDSGMLSVRKEQHYVALMKAAEVSLLCCDYQHKAIHNLPQAKNFFLSRNLLAKAIRCDYLLVKAQHGKNLNNSHTQIEKWIKDLIPSIDPNPTSSKKVGGKLTFFKRKEKKPSKKEQKPSSASSQWMLHGEYTNIAIFGANFYLDKYRDMSTSAGEMYQFLPKAIDYLEKANLYAKKFFTYETQFTIFPSEGSSLLFDPLKSINVHPIRIRIMITTARLWKEEKRYHQAMILLKKAQYMISDLDRLSISAKARICRPEVMQLQEKIFSYLGELYSYWFKKNQDIGYLQKSIEQFSSALALSIRLEKMLHCFPSHRKNFAKIYAISVLTLIESYPKIAVNMSRIFFHAEKAMDILRVHKLNEQVKKIEQFKTMHGLTLPISIQKQKSSFSPLSSLK